MRRNRSNDCSRYYLPSVHHLRIIIISYWRDINFTLGAVNSEFEKSILRRESKQSNHVPWHCTARQCSPLGRKFMECYIIKPAQSLLMKHLVIGQRQNAPDFSAFHWSPRGNLVSIGQHFVITRVVHLPKRTETSLITESDRLCPIR